MTKVTPVALTAFCLLLSSAVLRADTLIDSFDNVDAWTPNKDGGNPPAVSLETAGREGSCLHLRYADTGNHWGNVRRALTVPPEATGLRLWLRVNRAAAGAAMHLWLFEADGDGYIVRLRPAEKDIDALDREWHEVTVPFSAFRFDPRGNKQRQFLTLDHMLIGCNYADFEVLVDELRFVSDEVKPMEMPRTPDLRINRSATGSVAILDEPTFERRPSHADPARLQKLLGDAGFGVTRLRAGDVCDASVLTKANFDALVLPQAPCYPTEGKEALRQYLKQGGAFFSTGGYAFDDLLAYSSEGWTKSDPSVQAKDMDTQAAPAVGLNTRFGEPGDTMKLHPEQLGVFDPSYLLQRVASVRAAPGQYLLPADWNVPAAMEGFAAVALIGSNSPVFPDDCSRWIPLLEGADALGRSRGPIGSLVHNYAGPYAGSSWAFFGVTNEDLFDGRRPELDRLLVTTIRRLCRPQFLHGLTTNLACYRQGEPVTLSATAKVPADSLGTARVHFEIDGNEVATVPLPADDAAATTDWKPGRFDRDFYRVRALLEVGGQVVDECETAFVVWDEKIVASGPSVKLERNYLNFREVPTFLCGANQTGMMWYSAFENPLVWDRDFEKMNDCGQNVLRILHFSPFARGTRATGAGTCADLRRRPLDTVRKTDAIVQLAQKHNVIVFLTLHDWLPVELTNEELAAQHEWAEFWTGRYKDVPGIFYDLQSEPGVHPPDTDYMRTLAQDWLAQRYGSFAQAQQAWQQSGSATEIDFGGKPAGWGDLRARDLDLFRAYLFNRWTKANAEGVRAGDPNALATVGFLQTATAADKLLGAENVDFTNTHFYGSVPTFRRVLKMIDRRFEGKSLSLGAFGAREAHDARTNGKLGDPAEESVPYFLAIGHYALGMGAAFMANWDWKEMPDCVFPWGVNHQDLVSKPVLEAYRNMSLLFRLMQPKYVEPQVYLLAPDSNRFGYQTDALHRALMQAIDWLFDCHVAFGVLNEQALNRLPKSAKALVWPLPYCPTDDTFSLVRKFVDGGGALCFTGDLRFNDSRRPERADRLSALGLKAEHGPVPPFDGEAASLPKEPAWGEAGKGRVCWIPYPMELRADAPGAAAYGSFLDAAKAPRLRVTPAEAKIHVFEVPLLEGSALVAYNDGGARVLTTIDGATLGPVSLELDPGRTGLVMVDNAGAVVAVESQGRAVIRGEELLSGKGHQAIASLDGKDVRDNRQLLVVPFSPGEVVLARRGSSPPLSGEVGEFRSAKWHRLGDQEVQAGGTLTLVIDETTSLDLRLVAAAGQVSGAQEAAARLLSRQRPPVGG